GVVLVSTRSWHFSFALAAYRWRNFRAIPEGQPTPAVPTGRCPAPCGPANLDGSVPGREDDSRLSWISQGTGGPGWIEFFIVWRGYGLLGLIPPVLGLVALGFLAENPIKVAVLGAGLTIALTGLAVGIGGWVLNRKKGTNAHSLYGLPLWVWGGLEVFLG